jgi:hypothetical protein
MIIIVSFFFMFVIIVKKWVHWEELEVQFFYFFTSCLWASSITNIVQYMLNVLSQMLQLIEIPNCYYDYYCSCSKSWFQFTCCYIYWYLQMYLSTRVRAFLLPWYRSLFLVLREVISKVVNSRFFLMKNVYLFARKIKSFFIKSY